MAGDTEMSSTPGPWFWTECMTIMGGNPFDVLLLPVVMTKPTQHASIMCGKANKRLITAAPALLEAVRIAIDYMNRTSSDPGTYHAEMMGPLLTAYRGATEDTGG